MCTIIGVLAYTSYTGTKRNCGATIAHFVFRPEARRKTGLSRKFVYRSECLLPEGIRRPSKIPQVKRRLWEEKRIACSVGRSRRFTLAKQTACVPVTTRKPSGVQQTYCSAPFTRRSFRVCRKRTTKNDDGRAKTTPYFRPVHFWCAVVVRNKRAVINCAFLQP